MATAADESANAQAQAEELLALQEIFGEDCSVHSADPGNVSFRVDVAVDLSADVITLRAEVPDGEALAAGGPEDLAAGVAAPIASAVERAEQVIRDKAKKAPVAPRLERSQSQGNAAYAEASVKHLPPVTLQVSFPPEYPESAPPQFDLACEWLSAEQLSLACAEMDARAEELQGCEVVFTWADLLRSDLPSICGLADVIKLVPAGEATDLRAIADCVDPLSSLRGFIAFDQQKELAQWRQQVHTCQICFSDKAGTQFVHLGGCDHTFCRECMEEMARLHVREGNLVELKCPRPDCRAEMVASMLEKVLDEEAFDRWRRLKMQQVLTSELDDVVFCPRCEEDSIDSPTFAEAVASEEEAPTATCRRCGFMFCAKCRGVAHAYVADCLSDEAFMMQVAMRRLDARPLSKSEQRQQKRAVDGRFHEIAPGDSIPSVDVTGSLQEAVGPMQEGDEIMSLSLGRRDQESRNEIWIKGKNDIGELEAALATPPPFVVKYRTPQGGLAERQRKKRMWEELMTLRAIKQDSQPCPRCKVRISRSQGCNHMRCTNCDTHFCYRCGAVLPPSNPYSHFSSGGCPTFDAQEARRIVAAQREGNDRVDNELADLQRQFGRQEEIFAQFQARRDGRRPTRQDFQERHRDETQCPTCRQWNGRNGGLNHVRCHGCRTSYCHHCKRKIDGVVSRHFGAQGCPQHGGGA